MMDCHSFMDICGCNIFMMGLIKKFEDYEKDGKKISEADTQTVLVESVIDLVGYCVIDPNVVKRASRAGKGSQEFDLEVYKDNRLFLP